MKLKSHLLITIFICGITLSSCESESKQSILEPEKTSLSLEMAQQVAQESFIIQSLQLRKDSSAEMIEKIISYKEFKMPYDFITYGEEPKAGHSLYISLHGGGATTAKTNDRQWQNQIKLYTPKEGIYVAPRAPSNTWNLWHRNHIDPMLSILIDRFIVYYGINPNKVYILGYSAGGDGVYKLAPRMADRWAGASMMAGHPGNAKPHNLINLPYFLQCGSKDAAYNRNEQCAKWGKMLDNLAKENHGHYPHKWIVYPEHGHWMRLECKQAIPWMAQHTRNPWPKKINWYQDDILHYRFAWLANESPKKGDFITAEIADQTITLISDNVEKITLRLSDELLNLDKEIIVKDKNNNLLFRGTVERSATSIQQSLLQRLDTTSVATATLEISL